MTTEDAKLYLAKREIPQLFECLMTGLMYHRPRDHIEYLRNCLDKIRTKGLDHVRWNLFIEQRRKTPLPPISPENGTRPHSAHSYYSSRESSKTEIKTSTPLPPIGGATKESAAAPKGKHSSPGSAPKTPIVLVMGGPGSGKAALCKMLVERYKDWVYLSMGSLLKKQITDKGSADEKWGMISDLLSNGDVAPVDVACDLLVDTMKQNGSAAGFFIEGYPRTLSEYEEFVNKVDGVKLVFLLDCEEYYLQSNLVARGREGGRIDDNLSAIAARISYFKENTLPVVKKFDDSGKLALINVEENAEPRDLFQQLVNAFDVTFQTGNVPLMPSAPSLPRPASGRRSPGSRTHSRSSSRSSITPVTHIDDIQVECVDDGRKPDLPQCPIIILMGGPGSGKLSQARRLVDRYEGFVHLSMGDILRSEIVAKGTAEDKWDLVGSLVQKGEMAPEEVTVELLVSSLKQNADAKCIILEGYPRDQKQVEEFNRCVGGVNLVVLLDCEEYFMKQRLISRQKESDRIDDNLNAIANRIRFFKNHTLPVVKYFDDQDKLAIVNGDRDIDEVFFDMANLFDFLLFGVATSTTDVPGSSAPVEDEAPAVIEETIVATQSQETGDQGNPAYAAELEDQGQQ